MLKVGVIFGGKTVEHEVSIITAVEAMANLDQEKYEIIPIYIAKDQEWYTGDFLKELDTYKDTDMLKRYAKNVVLYNKKGQFFLQTKGLFKVLYKELDIVLPIVHGNNVEDGTLQGYLATIGIPFVGSGVSGSALGQDKVFMKQVFKDNNLPVVDYVWFYDTEYFKDEEKINKQIDKLGFPVIVKPATLGSSIGINKVTKKEELKKAIDEAINYDKKIVVEKAVTDMMEVNCSVIGSYEYQNTSEIEEVLGKDAILSYQDKYIGEGKIKGAKKVGRKTSKGMASATRILPANIDKKLETAIKETSKEVFRVLDLSGVCRIDYLIDRKTNKFYINEPNTIPGALSFYLWEATNMKYKDLLDNMITTTIKEFKKKEKKTASFDTNILSYYNGLKGSKNKIRG